MNACRRSLPSRRGLRRSCIMYGGSRGGERKLERNNRGRGRSLRPEVEDAQLRQSPTRDASWAPLSETALSKLKLHNSPCLQLQSFNALWCRPRTPFTSRCFWLLIITVRAYVEDSRGWGPDGRFPGLPPCRLPTSLGSGHGSPRSDRRI